MFSTAPVMPLYSITLVIYVIVKKHILAEHNDFFHILG